LTIGTYTYNCTNTDTFTDIHPSINVARVLALTESGLGVISPNTQRSAMIGIRGLCITITSFTVFLWKMIIIAFIITLGEMM